MIPDVLVHELSDRMVRDECPICAYIASRSHLEMDFLLYENVNDGEIRNRFLCAGGFCLHHSKMLLDHGDPLGHAILYSHLLSLKIARVQGKKDSLSRDICLFCSHESSHEQEYIRIFSNAWLDPDFSSQYRESGVLCLPHLFLVTKHLKEDHQCLESERLKKFTLEKYQEISHNLAEIQRKSDSLSSREPWTEQENRAWRKVVSLLIDQGEYRRTTEEKLLHFQK